MDPVVVVGAGFTGVAVAVHLSRAPTPPRSITLVDPRPVPGHGLAHGSPHPDHRLNAPAAIHTIHPDAPLHLVEWLRDGGALAADPGAVAPNGAIYPRRADFGRYMAAELERHARAASPGCEIAHVRDRVVAVRRTAGGLAFELAGGRTLRAGRGVLALGWNAVGVPDPLRGADAHPGWIGDPWDLERIAAIPRDARVLLLGTSLTACDAFAVLAAQGHTGPVLALSRRGMRPAAQNPFPSTLTSVWGMLRDPEPAFLRRHGRPATLRAALRALRADVAALDPSTASWQAPFDDLRDGSMRFWPDWPDAQKRRFVRHAKPWYDTFRFRNPPQVERIVDDGLARGQLALAAGRLRGARPSGAAIEVDYDARADGARRTSAADVVVNCTGPRPLPGASGHPLWTRLIADGLVRDHPCGLGVQVDEACRTIDATGRANDDLLAFGPPTIGTFGEVSAVPFIARQVIDALGEAPLR